jgi:nucleotide-binding universal stress UspA family protein
VGPIVVAVGSAVLSERMVETMVHLAWPRKALAATARRAGASAIVVGRSSAGRLSRLLRGPDPARTLLDRASCTLIAVRD